jgi:plastocyanin
MRRSGIAINSAAARIGGHTSGLTVKHMRCRIYTLLSTAAVAALLATGCGGGSSGPSAGAAPNAGGSSGSPSGITISNFKFSPSTLQVKNGARIKVANDDSTAHTVTADDGHSFESGNVDSSGSTTITAPAKGTYAYHCSIHPFMKGKLVVQ